MSHLLPARPQLATSHCRSLAIGESMLVYTYHICITLEPVFIGGGSKMEECDYSPSARHWGVYRNRRVLLLLGVSTVVCPHKLRGSRLYASIPIHTPDPEHRFPQRLPTQLSLKSRPRPRSPSKRPSLPPDPHPSQLGTRTSACPTILSNADTHSGRMRHLDAARGFASPPKYCAMQSCQTIDGWSSTASGNVQLKGYHQ